MKTKTATWLALIFVSAAAVAVFAVSRPLRAETTETPAPAVDVSDLETKIREQRGKLDELERKKQIYEQNIAKRRQEALSLQNQIAILDDQIANTDVEIQKLNLEVELLGSEIERLDASIELKNTELKHQKERLGELVRLLQRYNSKTTLEITLLNDTFADFFNQLKYLETIEEETKDGLDELEALKADLELDKSDREERRTQRELDRQQLGTEKKNLESQQTYREELFVDTKQSEEQFEALLDQAKQEQLNANADIQSLEAQIRQRLSNTNELPAGPTAFLWPVTSRKVTAYFHDPTYPFKKYFEHPAIDIATPQGTAVRAAATGFVQLPLRFQERKAPLVPDLGYTWIMVVHGDNLSTVYGHVSQIAVANGDYVVQGQVIGYSGGTPGTPGAGRLTTGPHLHLEVRLNGIPVDPLGYLPK